jgi:hypothetical protein
MRNIDTNDITTMLDTISRLAARAIDATDPAVHDILWSIQELSRLTAERISQAESIAVV